MEEKTKSWIEKLPPEKRRPAFRRVLIVGSAGFIYMSVIVAADLLKIENGTVSRVSTWAPVAGIYNSFGFWPAVLFVPAVFILFLALSIPKLLKFPKA